jgi:hypothetical protein
MVRFEYQISKIKIYETAFGGSCFTLDSRLRGNDKVDAGMTQGARMINLNFKKIKTRKKKWFFAQIL